MAGSNPDEFMVRYEVRSRGYLFNLRWDNNQLFLKQFSDGSQDIQKTLTPSEDAWNDFFHILNELDAWEWYNEYLMACNGSCVVQDEWEVSIKFEGEIIESHGWDSYPLGFRDFLKALEELTGVLIEFIHDEN